MKNFEFLSSIANINPFLIWALYLLSGGYLFLSLRKQKLSYISYFFIIVSFAGVFEFTGGLMSRFFDLLILLIVSYNILLRKIGKINTIIKTLFLLYTVAYVIMIFFHGLSDPLSDLRQYLIYAMPFLVYIQFHKVRFHLNYKMEMEVFIRILNTQIFASIIKLILIGFNEKIVGTLTISGGAVAAVFPVVYFVVIWYKNKGNLTRKDWLWIIASLLVAIASNKRAVWFIFPITVYAFLYAFNKLRINFSTVFIVFIIAGIFYAGVRSNATLNPEKRVGGSFDLEYVYSYVIKYNVGKNEEIDQTVGIGRMGSNIYYTRILVNDFFETTTLFGFGNAEYNKYSGKDVENADVFGFASKFMLTGWTTILVRIGSVVLFIFLIAFYNMINTIKRKRDFYLMLFVFGTWFIFYAGVLVTNLLLLSSFLFTIFMIQAQSNTSVSAIGIRVEKK